MGFLGDLMSSMFRGPGPEVYVGGGDFMHEISWRQGTVPGFEAEIHAVLPYSLDEVPLMRVVSRSPEFGLHEHETAIVTGHNLEVLRHHVVFLQYFVDSAERMIPGFHPGFRLEANRLGFSDRFPPRKAGDQEVSVSLPTMMIEGRTPTGRVPKHTLAVSFVLEGDAVLRDGRMVHPVRPGNHTVDTAVGYIHYLADGKLGKASLHLWRGYIRWSVECVTQRGGIVIARIERQSLDDERPTRYYDYKAR